jgi:ABC-type nickel/cobalt efflux system permease component RcnA
MRRLTCGTAHAPLTRERVVRRTGTWARAPVGVAVGLVAVVAMTLLALTHLTMEALVTVVVALALASLAFSVVREG